MGVKMNPNISFMRQVSKDLIDIKITSRASFRSMKNEFWKIMRKHGIKRGTKSKDGSVLGNNFEWTICENLFLLRVQNLFMFDSALGNISKDLKHY